MLHDQGEVLVSSKGLSLCQDVLLVVATLSRHVALEIQILCQLTSSHAVPSRVNSTRDVLQAVQSVPDSLCLMSLN